MKFQTQQPSLRIIDEPMIKVGNNIELPDPKLGLNLFGTFREHDEEINIKAGVIGDSASIEEANEFFTGMKTEVQGLKQNLLHIGFPGLETDSKLNVKITLDENWNARISDAETETAIKPDFLTDRIEEVVKVFETKMKNILDRESNPDIIIFAIPQKIFEKCVNIEQGRKRKLPWQSTEERRIKRMRRDNQSLNKWMGIEESEQFEVTNLRRYLKGKAMRFEIPTQIILPRTLKKNNPNTQDQATKAWNLIAGLIYKSNNVPWKVSGLDPNTCYMGIAFYKDLKSTQPWMRTSLAQVFSFNTEGLVLKGGQATVDKETNSPHLSKEDSKNLVQEAIKGYKQQTGAIPRRLVIHKTSRFIDKELEGFKEGSKDIPELEMVALGSRGFKLIRWGSYPPIRGTMIKLPDKSILLYTFGYIPYLDTYPGHRIPSPLEILEHHGSSQSDKICAEILALTKMNWNNASFCCKAPITIAFARRVGDILRETPSSITPKPRFKYYM